MEFETKHLPNEEQKILDWTVDIHSTFLKLEQTHPDDINCIVDAIHEIQKVIAIRAVRREYPHIFPTKYSK